MSRRRTRTGRSGAAVLVAALAVAIVAGGAGLWLGQRAPLAAGPRARPAVREAARSVPAPPAAPARTEPQSSPPAPAQGAAPLDSPPESKPAVQAPAADTPSAPPAAGPAAYRAAIIFDDAGGSLHDLEQIIAIGRSVAVAILPGLAHSSEVARRAREAGLEVLLHQPLESDAGLALGPGAITTAMGDEEIQTIVRANLASLRGAAGLNNHMGSRGTADRRVMRAVLEVARRDGMYFIDSRTSRATVAESIATELGVPTASRAIFLDNENEQGAIREQLRRLIALARERGSAIAIGHAPRLTPGVLASMMKEFDRAEVAIVPPSRLVR